MRRMRAFLHSATIGVLLGAAACESADLVRPSTSFPADPLFASYVSVGNSITAGFQSGGITDSVQRRAYPFLLAQQMGTAFHIPAMTDPGCPSLFTDVFTQTRVSPAPCFLRAPDSIPGAYVNNVAVPGAEVMDAVANLDTASNANALTTFFLGGLTQIEMLRRAQPTFVTVWIGNNDVLGAATNTVNGGDSTAITPPAVFATRYNQMMADIDAAGPASGVLLGVANVTVIPYFSLGSTYWAIDNGLVPGQAFPPMFTVGPNCAPNGLGGNGDAILVPFPFGGALLTAALGGAPTTLTCTEDQTVQPEELAKLVATVTAYNQTIEAAATARNWIYVDPNPTLDSLRLIQTEVAPFPAFGFPCSTNPFGLAFSCDGVHPSARTHKLLANKLIQAINAVNGTALSAIP